MNKAGVILRCIAGTISLACLLAANGCQRQEAPTAELSSVNTDVSEMDSVVSEAQPQASSEMSVATSQEGAEGSDDHASPSESALESQTNLMSTESKVASQVDTDTVSTIDFIQCETTGHWLDFDSILNPFDAVIVQNTEEFQASVVISDKEIESNDLLLKYDSSFFQNHALILMTTEYSYCNCRDVINSITRVNDQLTIDYTHERNVNAPLGQEQWVRRVTILQVDKSDIIGVSEISPKQHLVETSEQYVVIVRDDSEIVVQD